METCVSLHKGRKMDRGIKLKGSLNYQLLILREKTIQILHMLLAVQHFTQKFQNKQERGKGKRNNEIGHNDA